MSVPTVQIERSDLKPFLRDHEGNKLFDRALRNAKNDLELFRLLSKYIYFNSVFGGGVANLAGEIAIRKDLFQDQEERIACIRDRADQIASHIFYAAIDEFGDRGTSKLFTHRALAQATLKATAEYFELTSKIIADLTRHNDIDDIIQLVENGYGLNCRVDEVILFKAIGFHMGSEVLADDEFNILEQNLKDNHSELFRHLQRSQAKIAGSMLPSHYWIHIHTSVEADHFSSAVRSANKALEYCSLLKRSEEMKQHILEGFEEFSNLQIELMKRLAGQESYKLEGHTIS